MNCCYLSLGSNQKHPERQIRLAMKAIKAISKTSILKTSSLYWSKAWGMLAQQDFCNAVVLIMTDLSPDGLLKSCQSIENRQGRIRKKHWGPRSLDIDIILYGNRTIKSPRLIIPHPHYLKREFVLLPLSEVNQKFNSLELLYE